MATTGDLILYFSIAASIAVLALLLLKEFKKKDEDNDILRKLPLYTTILLAVLLTVDLLLLTYYFVASDFTYMYVWEYSSRDLPLIYKISGVWAGQQGTYLLWVWIIYISAMWLSLSTGLRSAIARRTQMVTLIIGIYLIILTIIQSPFSAWLDLFKQQSLANNLPLESVINFYEKQYGTFSLDTGFADGNGLNALLVNFWMVVHPPLMFIGYGAMTVPFAATLVYLITKDEGWELLARQWTRFTWLFLGLGIAVGGLWSYLVLGWGGFWAWDPVETASLIPWLTLTGYMHAATFYRRDRNTFSIAAPMLAAASFVLVVYAAMVTRSGLFNSVHAFGSTSTGSMLLILVFISSAISIVIGLKRYLEGNEDQTKEETDSRIGDIIKNFFSSKTNIFYITLLLFILLSFVSFWGITFPVIVQLVQGIKVGIASDTKNFFNVWSFPFTILLLISLGFCLRFKKENLDKELKILFGVVAATIIAGIIRTPNFYLLDHNNPFFISEPAAYRLVGSISLLAVFPAMGYALVATYQKFSEYLEYKEIRQKIRGVGISIIHFGIVFILFGVVISVSFTQSYDTQNFPNFNVPLSSKGSMWDTGVDGYSFKLLDYRPGQFQTIELEVYKDGKMIGKGEAEYVEKKGVSATHPLVDRSLSGDVYVIFQGESKGFAPLTLKIIPSVNNVWIGVILFAVGIVMIMTARIGIKRQDALT